jgi:phosphate-selective porin OprO/OprP
MVAVAGLLAASSARAAEGTDAEIALLKQQLKMLEQKLDRLQKQTTANTQAAAKANAKADTAKADVKTAVANANAAIPTKGPLVASGVVVTMPNNRPTI